MSQNIALAAYPEPLRILAFGDISGTYAPIGDPFYHPIKFMILQNDTDVSITFSWDGVTDHLQLPSTGQLVLDIGSNSSLPIGALYFQKGDRIYASGSPSMGAVYLSVFFAVSTS
jgi:hypothetical protein